jgi:hypothetical protein
MAAPRGDAEGGKAQAGIRSVVRRKKKQNRRRSAFRVIAKQIRDGLGCWTKRVTDYPEVDQ